VCACLCLSVCLSRSRSLFFSCEEYQRWELDFVTHSSGRAARMSPSHTSLTNLAGRLSAHTCLCVCHVCVYMYSCAVYLLGFVYLCLYWFMYICVTIRLCRRSLGVSVISILLSDTPPRDLPTRLRREVRCQPFNPVAAEPWSSGASNEPIPYFVAAGVMGRRPCNLWN